MSKIKTYVDVPFWFIRKTNTDIKYMQEIDKMSKYSNLDFLKSKEIKLVLECNLEWIKGIISRIFKIKFKTKFYRYLSNKQLKSIDADIVLSHGKLPINNLNIPTIWIYGVVDPIQRLKNNVTVKTIENEYKIIENLLPNVSGLILQTKKMQKRHQEHFPKFKDKIFYLPFFLSYLKFIDKEQLIKKHSNDKIKLLFIGREAYRKGLDILLESYKEIQANYPNNIFELTIVTKDLKFKEKYLDIENVIWHNEINKQKVLELMHEAQVFVMPSRFESYGLVYIEAMASGCVVIAPNNESQSEILDDGACGILIEPNTKDLIKAIEIVINKKLRSDLALKAIEKCKKEYSPEIVAKKHEEIFIEIYEKSNKKIKSFQ